MPKTDPHLTGPQHYVRAEQLIQNAEEQRQINNDRSQTYSQLALVHIAAAQLAFNAAGSLFDAGIAPDWDAVTEHLAPTILAGWPEVIR